MKSVTARVSVGLLLSAVSASALAESWVLTPFVTAGISHDDNYRLTTEDHDSTDAVNLRAGLNFQRIDDIYTVDGKLQLDFNKLDGEDIPDENNQFLRLNLGKRAELDQFKLSGVYKRDSTLNDVIEPFDLNDPLTDPNADSAISTARVRRTTTQLIPSWEHRINERTRTVAQYDLRDVNYRNVATTDLVDFTSHELSGSVLYNLSERDTARASLAYLQYDGDRVNTDYDSIALTGGLERAFSETTRGGFNLGFRTTDGDQGDSDGIVFDVYGSHKTEVGTLTGKYSHDLATDGTGGQNETDQLILQLDHSYTPVLSLSLRGRYMKVDAENDNNDRDYFAIEPSVSWNFKRWWSLDVGYAYRLQEYDRETTDADSNMVFMSVTYSKPTGPDR